MQNVDYCKHTHTHHHNNIDKFRPLLPSMQKLVKAESDKKMRKLRGLDLGFHFFPSETGDSICLKQISR